MISIDKSPQKHYTGNIPKEVNALLSIERRNMILETLQQEKRVVVSALSQRFDVSEETIRRDLEKLERDGYATRTYGGALLNEDNSSELPYTVRKKTNVEAKKVIAAQVAELIRDGDFIMLDESSTSTFVAKAIKTKRNITLITNSIEIILEVSSCEGWHILSTGGALKSGVLSLTGHQAESMIRSYHVDKAIISCTGLDLETGFTEAGDDNARIKKAMIAAARQTILAADSRKFDRVAFAPICKMDQLYALVTDKEPADSWCSALKQSGVLLISPETSLT